MDKRCVVTGIGVVSSVGTGKDKFWNSLVEGKSGVSRITYFDTSEIPVSTAGEVKDFNPADYIDEDRLFMLARGTRFAVGAAKMAFEDAAISPENTGASRVGLFSGTSSAPMDAIEEQITEVLTNCEQNNEGGMVARPYAVMSVCPHTPAMEISHHLDCFDTISTLTTVCTSGSNAIGAGLREIRAGRKDIVLAGATETTISLFTFLGFISAGLLAHDSDTPPEKIMRPFDRDRNSGVLAEGAAFVVLEELEHAKMRGARIYGELKGYAQQNMLSGPKSSRRTMEGAARGALADARTHPDEVDYISANGTSSVVLDRAETQMLKEIFGDYAYRLPISAIKSTIGIPNSAVGPMQLAATLLSYQTDILPPTINYENPDPECDLDYVPNVARINRVNTTLINNMGLDGGVSALVVKRYNDGARGSGNGFVG
jgi:3-oxoacyl-[acyl-carrier-protein] synthase II